MSGGVNAKPIRQQFADTMLAVGQEDERLAVLLGDISHFILQPFARACPGRFYNVGICEPTIISMAAGLAKVGFFPVVHTIAPFIIERSFEQIKLDFCYQQLGGNLITVGSMFDYANLGCTHHCYGDFALLKSLPRTQITYPGSAVEFDALFRQTYRSGLVTLFRIPGHQHNVELEPERVRFGQGIKLTDGRNLTLVATGPQLGNAMAARDSLAAHGWASEVIYIHTVHPLDRDLVRQSVLKTRRVLVVEEHMENGGLGDDVLRTIKDIDGVRHATLAVPNVFITAYGSYQDHCERVGLTRDGIVRRVKENFGAPAAGA